jgi:MFS family permease
LGLVLACSGVIGLWAIGFYSPDLTRQVLTKRVTAQVFAEQIAEASTERADQLNALQAAIKSKNLGDLNGDLKALKAEIDKKISGRLAIPQSFTSIAINTGAFFGMFGFGWLAQRIGRKKTFAMALIAACITTATVFWTLNEYWQIFVLVPIMGFCQLSLFAGYAMYFPELFPTRLRSTGTSFCYNVGRFVAAFGPLIKIYLNDVFKKFGEDAIRYAGVSMCAVFLIGLFVLPFLPETKGQPLPE